MTSMWGLFIGVVDIVDRDEVPAGRLTLWVSEVDDDRLTLTEGHHAGHQHHPGLGCHTQICDHTGEGGSGGGVNMEFIKQQYGARWRVMHV